MYTGTIASVPSVCPVENFLNTRGSREDTFCWRAEMGTAKSGEPFGKRDEQTSDNRPERMVAWRESESKSSLEGGSRWSDSSSALPSVGYLGAVQPLLGTLSNLKVEGRDWCACLPARLSGCLDHLQCLRPGYLVCSRGHTTHCFVRSLTGPPERVHRIFNTGGHWQVAAGPC